MSEQQGAKRAPTEQAQEVSSSPPQSADGTLVPDATEEPVHLEVNPGAARTEGRRYRIAGILSVLAGVALAVAPRVSGQLAQALAPLGNIQVPSGTLILAGLLFFCIGTLLRTLSRIRGTVDCVVDETLRLEQLTTDSQALRADLSVLQETSASVDQQLDALHEKTEQLIECASDPTFQVSIFRMAASLDQLGERLDSASQERFDSLPERFDSLEDGLGALTEQARKADAGLLSKLDHLGASLQMHDDGMHTAFDAGLEKVDETAAGTGQRLDRFSEDTKRRHEALSGNLARLTDETAESAARAAAGIEDLRKRLDRQIEGQAVASAEKFAGVEARLERLDHEHSCGLERLGEQMAREVARVSDALRQGLVEAAAEQARRGVEQLAADEQRLARFESSVLQELAELRAVLQEASRAPEGTSSELEQALDQLGSRIEQALDVRAEVLSDELIAISQLATETTASDSSAATDDEPRAEPSPSWEEPAVPDGESSLDLEPEPPLPSASDVPFGYNLDFSKVIHPESLAQPPAGEQPEVGDAGGGSPEPDREPDSDWRFRDA